jgi:hypothetical protein
MIDETYVKPDGSNDVRNVTISQYLMTSKSCPLTYGILTDDLNRLQSQAAASQSACDQCGR